MNDQAPGSSSVRRYGGEEDVVCSFCGEGRSGGRRFVAGPDGVFICDECVALCAEVLAEARPGPSRP
jgi:ATP-dependent Clp protease ATP-binding subunit ClpX